MMKIGLISDIHANYQALKAVLEALAEENCIKIICCGDIIGYGPEPRACLETVREGEIPCVRGNHDEMMLAISQAADLRKDVRESLQWTHAQLSAEEREWLGKLPMSVDYPGFTVVHSSNVLYPPWLYAIDVKSVMANFLFQTRMLTFNGHSHVPMLASHQRGDRPRLNRLSDTVLSSRCRYLLNVGSVGQPRDRDPRASYVVYDTAASEVKLRRIEYDIGVTQSAIRAAGLPEKLSLRLEQGL